MSTRRLVNVDTNFIRKYCHTTSDLYCGVVHHKAPVLDGAIRHKVDEDIIVVGGDGVRGHTGVTTIFPNYGGVLVVSVPDLKIVISTVPTSLNVKVSVIKYIPKIKDGFNFFT